METAKGSTLKEWPEPERFNLHVEGEGSWDLLRVPCPSCGVDNFVLGLWLHVDSEIPEDPADRKAPHHYGTRACSYCFKTAWLPGRHPSKGQLFDRAEPKGRRIVKRRKSTKAK